MKIFGENKKIKYRLIILFEIIFLVKIGISILREGAFIFPDESCVIQRAMYFADHLKIAACSSITGFDVGSPYPLYSIVISPILKILPGIKGYTLVLIFNSLLVSLLVFPLYGIFQKFLHKQKHLFAAIFFTLFLASVSNFEQTLMTEALFIVINIWLLYFYLNSFGNEAENRRNKVISVVLSLLATITRPFGFIMPVAIFINELARSGRKKKMLWFFPVLAILVFAVVHFLSADFLNSGWNKILSLSNTENVKRLFIAIANQVNSFTIGTFLIPVIVFFHYFSENKSPILQNIRVFLYVVIALNFVASSQHIYGYFLHDGFNVNTITRYINISLIYILIFSIIFLQTGRKFNLNLKTVILTLVLLVSFTQLKYDFNVTLNLDISHFISYQENLDTKLFTSYGPFKPFLVYSLCILLLLLVFNQKRILVGFLTILLMANSIFSQLWMSNFANNSPFADFFENQKKNLVFVINDKESRGIDETWRLLSQSRARINIVQIEKPPGISEQDFIIPREKLAESRYFKDADYIISDHKIDLKLEYTLGNNIKIYSK